MLISIPASWLLGSEELCSVTPSQQRQTEPLKLSQPIPSSLRLLLPSTLHWDEKSDNYGMWICSLPFCSSPYLSMTLSFEFCPWAFLDLIPLALFLLLSQSSGDFSLDFFLSLHIINTEEPFYKVKSKVFKISKYLRAPIYKFNRYLVNIWGGEDYDN